MNAATESEVMSRDKGCALKLSYAYVLSSTYCLKVS